MVAGVLVELGRQFWTYHMLLCFNSSSPDQGGGLWEFLLNFDTLVVWFCKIIKLPGALQDYSFFLCCWKI